MWHLLVRAANTWHTDTWHTDKKTWHTDKKTWHADKKHDLQLHTDKKHDIQIQKHDIQIKKHDIQIKKHDIQIKKHDIQIKISINNADEHLVVQRWGALRGGKNSHLRKFKKSVPNPFKKSLFWMESSAFGRGGLCVLKRGQRWNRCKHQDARRETALRTWWPWNKYAEKKNQYMSTKQTNRQTDKQTRLDRHSQTRKTVTHCSAPWRCTCTLVPNAGRQ